jgi:small-conductance mechanosensitive channel
MAQEKAETANETALEPVDSVLTEGVEELVDMGVEDFIQTIGFAEQLKPVSDLLKSQPWLNGLVLLLIFLALAKVVEWGLIPLIRRIISRKSPQVGDAIIGHVRSPLFWSISLMGGLLAATAMGVGEDVRGTLVSIVLSVLIFLWMLFATRVSKLLLFAASQRGRPNALVRPQTLPLFVNLVAIAIFVLAIYFIFQSWHVDMTAWLASAGIAGIAIGFAAKDTLANLFSGVFIMADSPYKIGDYVVLDDGVGLRGKVTHIGIRSTRLLTRDDVEVTIPNSIMGNSKVVNESGGPHQKFRIRVSVGVAYGSDIDQVRDVLMSVAESSDAICDDPEPRVRFRAFGASSLDFDLLCWVENPELRGRVLDALNTAVYKRFQEEGIEIPYAKQDLYIKEMPPAPGEAG